MRIKDQEQSYVSKSKRRRVVSGSQVLLCEGRIRSRRPSQSSNKLDINHSPKVSDYAAHFKLCDRLNERRLGGVPPSGGP